MNRTVINSANEIPDNALSFDALCWQYGTGQAYSILERGQKKSQYRNGVATKLGDIEASVWYILAERLIELAGEQVIQEALTEWYGDHHKALQAHISRLYDDPCWVDYLAFNNRYRPDLLKGKPFPVVHMSCCGREAVTTEERINQGSVCCPWCGVFPEFELTGKTRCYKNEEVQNGRKT